MHALSDLRVCRVRTIHKALCAGIHKAQRVMPRASAIAARLERLFILLYLLPFVKPLPRLTLIKCTNNGIGVRFMAKLKCRNRMWPSTFEDAYAKYERAIFQVGEDWFDEWLSPASREWLCPYSRPNCSTPVMELIMEPTTRNTTAFITTCENHISLGPECS
ncbi:hypothetical protein J6590_028584 [Homalodisca vitripennis]|nr:hypothetical protein J6590_028584 [Homalodisca vitripennis]